MFAQRNMHICVGSFYLGSVYCIQVEKPTDYISNKFNTYAAHIETKWLSNARLRDVRTHWQVEEERPTIFHMRTSTDVPLKFIVYHKQNKNKK